jgi:hypothetical protein
LPGAGALDPKLRNGRRFPAAAAGNRAERQEPGRGVAVCPDEPEVRRHLEAELERVRASQSLLQDTLDQRMLEVAHVALRA